MHRHNVGEEGAAGLVARLHQITHGDDVAADAPADRRRDLRVLQVQLGPIHGGSQGLQGAGCFSSVPSDLVVLFLANRFHWEQLLGSRGVRVQAAELRFGLCHVAFRLSQRRLVGAWIDLEQHVPLLDQRPFLEVDLVQVAPHVGPHLHRIDRGRPGREVCVVRDLPLDEVADRD